MTKRLVYDVLAGFERSVFDGGVPFKFRRLNTWDPDANAPVEVAEYMTPAQFYYAPLWWGPAWHAVWDDRHAADEAAAVEAAAVEAAAVENMDGDGHAVMDDAVQHEHAGDDGVRQANAAGDMDMHE
jgi:hypothetical protein